jgi:uncharacterized membrane protein
MSRIGRGRPVPHGKARRVKCVALSSAVPAAATAPVDRPAPPRLPRLDALRGAAIIWMAAFHFVFDLAHFGFVRQNFHTDPFWTVQRSCIVSLFLFCAGVGQAVALERAQGWPRFWRRWAQVAGCALLVSLGSWLMFPRSFISFGVLHGLALMLIAARFAAPLRGWLLPLGAVALLLPRVVQHPFFDTRATNWVGLVTRKPVTEDYVPFLPWFGVICLGLAAGQWLLARHGDWVAGRLARPFEPLALLGRWSLSFSMLHQPVLIGALLAWKALRGQ